MENNLFLVDWLSFRVESFTVPDAINYLGLSGCEFTMANGFYGYRTRYWMNGISIHTDHSGVSGVLVEMSGQGCRALETFSSVPSSEGSLVTKDWVSIFKDILHNKDFVVTRLDYAFDDKTGCIPFSKLVRDYRRCNVVSRFKDKSITREDHLGEKGPTLYFGSPQSEIRFRIYDKAYQLGFDDGSHWVRFEVQLRRDLALKFIELLDKSDYAVGSIFSAVVNNYFRFVKPDKTDSNKRRWKTAAYWSALVDDVMPVSLWVSRDVEYNKARCEDYVYRMAGNSVAALIELEGLSGFAEKLKKEKSKKVPDRIKNMIATEKMLMHQSRSETEQAENNGNAILDVIGECPE